MKKRTFFVFMASIIGGLLLLALVSFVSAQSGGTDEDNELGIKSSNTTAAIVSDVVQVQGRLTDASGHPITSTVSVTASIYDVSSGGTARCTDTDSVTPVNGLFTMAMNYCAYSDFNGDQLWLGIKVGADAEMTPRQAIYAVPYAWGLRPGAIVKGADSYIFIPGSALVKNLSSDTTRWDMQVNGGAMVYRGTNTGTKTIYYPITLPGSLYGQPVTIEQVTVYYKSTANSYISSINMSLQTDVDSSLTILADSTHLTSTTASYHVYTPTGNNVLSASQGFTGLYMNLSFANDTEAVTIGGIRLHLSHQ